MLLVLKYLGSTRSEPNFFSVSSTASLILTTYDVQRAKCSLSIDFSFKTILPT